jgi:ABC-type nitrate/sulfonate/bicarbonate transport system substrate-binding protein
MISKQQRQSLTFLPLTISITVIIIAALSANVLSEEHRIKVRISNTGFTIQGLPLLAARDWGIFAANGIDVEYIVIAASLAYPALVAGSLDYVAGIGPSSTSATLSGLPLRAMWFSSDKAMYWLMSQPQHKTLESLKMKKIGISAIGGANQVSLFMALDKLGRSLKEYTMVSLPGQDLLKSLESGYLDAASLNPPAMFSAQKKGFNKVLDTGAMQEMPTGGLTSLIRTLQTRPAEVKRVIRSLQLAKEEIRKSKDKTVDLIIRVLKIDRETASQTYDSYVPTLNPTGIPTQAGMESVVKALRMLGRFTDRQIPFTEIADDSLATEVAREMGYKISN